MIFKDEVEIFVKSGKGGDGAVSFRREKFIPCGGPDGGDGGDGGDIICKVNPHLNTLSYFHDGQKFESSPGGNGDGNQCFGKQGACKILEVPQGTIISEIAEDGTKIVIADMSSQTELHHVFRGGKGGKGNIHFKSAVRQSPQYAKKGTLGIEKNLVLELKLIAHIGLVGFPNAGKSSLISCLTNSRPKVAHYPFTTLIPNLGMMIPDYFGDGLIIADIPGLIPGASQGKGLGIEFLKHIERTKLLLFILDITDHPEEKFSILRQELSLYSQKLSLRNYVICFNKIDLMPEIDEKTQLFMDMLKSEQIPFFLTSAATQNGLAVLKKELFTIWNNIPNDPKDMIEYIPTDVKNQFEDFTIGLDL